MVNFAVGTVVSELFNEGQTKMGNIVTAGQPVDKIGD